MHATMKECEELNIWEKLRETMIANPNGIGLSANQIGIYKRAFMVRYVNSKGEVSEHRYLNPRILDRRNLIKYRGEGGTSFPGI